VGGTAPAGGRTEQEEAMATNDTAWTLESVQQLTAMAREGIPVSVMSLKLRRPIEIVAAKLSQLGLTPVPETGA
jgi:hypothetical protein